MIDPYSETWAAVATHADDQIARARLALETRGMSAVETEYERGRIAALKAVLSLAQPKRRPEIHPEPGYAS